MPLRAVVKDRINIRFGWALLVMALVSLPLRSWAQAGVAPGAATQARITAAIDESRLVTLRGNTHPLARREFDQGAAPSALPMRRMLLVLQRSPAQEAALAALLEQQQDPGSPNYRQWLTPEQLGQQFGPADQDIQTVTLWLQSHGFQVARVSQSHMVIEFSGTASQVLQAFHAPIHKYTVERQGSLGQRERPADSHGAGAGRRRHRHAAQFWPEADAPRGGGFRAVGEDRRCAGGEAVVYVSGSFAVRL